MAYHVILDTLLRSTTGHLLMNATKVFASYFLKAKFSDKFLLKPGHFWSTLAQLQLKLSSTGAMAKPLKLPIFLFSSLPLPP